MTLEQLRAKSVAGLNKLIASDTLDEEDYAVVEAAVEVIGSGAGDDFLKQIITTMKVQGLED